MAGPTFEFGDTKTFEENLAAFSVDIASADPILGGAMKPLLPGIAAGKLSNGEVWDALIGVATKQDVAKQKLKDEKAATGTAKTNDDKAS